MRKLLPAEKYYHLINHGPCVLVTSGNLNDYRPNKRAINAAPIAWITPVNDDPPLVAACIASNSYTASLILKYRELVINVVGKTFIKAILNCGKTTGSKTDKFSAAKLTPLRSKTVKAPYLKNSIGHIECSVIDKKEYDGVYIFVGRVNHCEVDTKFYDGKLITEKAMTPHHVGAEYFFFSGRRKKF